MNALRFAAGVSLVANLALAWAAWPRFRHPEPPQPPSAPIAVSADRLPSAGTPPRQVTAIDQVADFRWSQIASPDYFVLRDNLRAIGCPEKTLRDLLEALVEREYGARAEAVLEPLAAQFWDLVARYFQDEDQFQKDFRGLEEQLDAIKDECRDVLEKLLGPNHGRPQPRAYEFTADARLSVDFLAPERQAAFAALELEFAQRQRELQDHRPAGEEAFREAFRALREDKQAALQAFFSPDEWQEYRLRTSPHANVRDLQGVELTEDEIRAVVVARLEADEKRRANSDQGGSSLAETMRRRYGLAPQTPSAETDPVQTVLSPERYAEFKRAEDGRYQEALRLTDRLGLSPELAASVYELSQAANQQAATLQSNPSWDEAQRQAARDALRTEVERSLKETLPPQAYELYTEMTGSWWRQLGAPTR